MWCHASIDGCAHDTCVLGRGQQRWALHCNAGSTGTLGHMPLPLQPFSSRWSPQSLADETWTPPSFVQWPCGSGRCYSCCQNGVSNIDLNKLTRLVPDGSTYSPQPLNSFSPLHHSRGAFTVELEACPTGCPLSEWIKPRDGTARVGRGRKDPCLDSLIIQGSFFFYKALRNSRLDLVSLIPTCHKHIPDLHQLSQRGRKQGTDGVLIPERKWVKKINFWFFIYIKRLILHFIWSQTFTYLFQSHGNY